MSKSTKVILGIIVVAVLIGGYRLWQQGQPAKPAKVGVIAPFTGEVADFGEDIRKGILDANVPGVEFIFEDDKCENPTAINTFKKLAELDRVSFIIGPACGGPQEVVAPLLKGKEIITLIPYAAGEELFERSGGKMFQIQYSLEDESKFLAEKMFKLGYQKIAIISYQNAFSETHARSFRTHYKGEIIREASFRDTTVPVASELLNIKRVNPDALFVTDVSFFFANGNVKLQELGIKLPIFSQYAIELPAIRPLVEGVSYSFPGELVGERGAIYGLAQESAKLLGELISACKGNYACVRDKLVNSPDFNEKGIRARPIVLKKIVNGVPTALP